MTGLQISPCTSKLYTDVQLCIKLNVYCTLQDLHFSRLCVKKDTITMWQATNLSLNRNANMPCRANKTPESNL